MKFVKLPNGKVWPIVKDDPESPTIRGIVRVPCFARYDNLETALDGVVEAVTGDSAALFGFSHQARGGDFVAFQGFLDLDEIEVTFLDAKDPQVAVALKAQYDLSDEEFEHAMNNLLDVHYVDECELDILGSVRTIHSPSYPAECDYIRVKADCFEIAYWVSTEWSEDPTVVMGAIIGAAAKSA